MLYPRSKQKLRAVYIPGSTSKVTRWRAGSDVSAARPAGLAGDEARILAMARFQDWDWEQGPPAEMNLEGLCCGATVVKVLILNRATFALCYETSYVLH